MQTVASTKIKYKIEDYVSSERAQPIIQNFSQKASTLICICRNLSAEGQTCFKCKQFTHCCIIDKPNRQNIFECSRCLNKSLDPLYQVKKVLVQSYFRTQSIFSYNNTVNFEFNLCHQDLSSSIVQVRGIIPGSTSLSWPMQGGFAINEQKNFHQFKPLLSNSNRKARREQYFTIPVDKLKLGKNFLKFKIPCLERKKFIASYQFEQKKIYYIAVNLVSKLTPSELQTKIFRERRAEKNESLQILKLNNSDIEITQNKVCLMCPYSKQRIKVPVRGRYCKHFNCICLQTLIASHSTSRYWSCPLCYHRINEPIVDVWIYSMLIDNQKGSEVLIRLDGTYEWVKQKENSVMSLESDQQSQPYRMPVQKPIIEQKVEKPEKNEVRIQKDQVRIQKNEVSIEKNYNVIDIEDDVEIVPPPPPAISKVQPVPKIPAISKVQPVSKKPLNDKAQQKKVIQNKEIELSSVLIVDQDQLISRQAQKKEVFAKMKEKLNKQNPNQIIQSILGNNTKSQTIPKPTLAQSKKSSTSLEPQQRIDKKNQEPKPERYRSEINLFPSKKSILYDIRTMQAREIRLQDFKRMHSKGKISKYKKYAQVEQLRKLFKEIL